VPLCMHSTRRDLDTNENAGAMFCINLHSLVDIDDCFPHDPVFLVPLKNYVFCTAEEERFGRKELSVTILYINIQP